MWDIVTTKCLINTLTFLIWVILTLILLIFNCKKQESDATLCDNQRYSIIYMKDNTRATCILRVKLRSSQIARYLWSYWNSKFEALKRHVDLDHVIIALINMEIPWTTKWRQGAPKFPLKNKVRSLSEILVVSHFIVWIFF